MTHRIVVGMTGATGQIYGVRALELLAETEAESHLVMSDAAKTTLAQELDRGMSDILALADEIHEVGNVGASPASGSFNTDGMIVTPCSMKTLSNIAHGNAGNLITRSADVTLKERRPLVLMPREKPFNRIHLENMLAVTDAGAIVFPPFPSFYKRDLDFSAMISRTVARALSQTGLDFPIEEYTGLDGDGD